MRKIINRITWSHRILCGILIVGLLCTVTVPALMAEEYSYTESWTNGETLTYGDITQLQPRVSGSEAERQAAFYIGNNMKKLGLDVHIQEFPITFFQDNGSELDVVDGDVLQPNTMQYSPPGEFTAEIVYVGLGYSSDYPDGGIPGKIALIKRGEFTFYDKTQNAAQAGALGAVIFNSEPDNLYGTLMSITDIPAVSISGLEGSVLLDLLNETPVTVHLAVDSFVEDRVSQNVIGTLEGTRPEKGIVYIGSHYDSVAGSPGANDDASGVWAMLKVASTLSSRSTNCTLKFIAFGSEETGLDGSFNYVNTNYTEVTEKGRGMINLDMIGVGDTLLIGNIGTSSSDLTNYTRDLASDFGFTWEPFTAVANSDHTYFEMNGVPAVFLHQVDDPWYHTENDTMAHINGTTLRMNSFLATATAYGWSNNLEYTGEKITRMEKMFVHHDIVYSKV